MLAPAALSALLGCDVLEVRRVARGVESSAYSGSTLTSVEVQTANGMTHLLLKPVSRTWDYFMRVTRDDRGREALAWTSGLLDRLPPEMSHAYIACARNDDGWAILMRDVSDTLLSSQGALDASDHFAMLDALAAFHATFWDDPQAARSEEGFNDPANFYHVISPLAAERDPDPSSVMSRIVHDGWQAVHEVLEPDLAAATLALANDPRPLRRALDRYPQTVVHGDMRAANLGIERGQPGERTRLLVLDWALVGREVPGLDLIWFLVGPGGPGTLRHDESIAHYRQCLATRLGERFDMAWWEPMLDLSLLGGLIRYAWIASRAITSRDPARRAQAEIDLAWLVPGARRGLALLS